MPIALLFVGVILVVTAIRGTESQLWNLVYNDITGQGTTGSGFFIWLAAILAVGAIGYYQPARRASDIFLAIIVVGIFLSNQGIFANFQQAITGIGQQQPAAATDPTAANLPAGIPVDLQQQSGTGALGSATSAVGSAAGAIGGITKIFSLF